MSTTDKGSMIPRLDDIERLVQLSCTQYDDAADAYQEAERVTRKKAAVAVGTPEHAHLCMVCAKAKQHAEDLYKEATETTRRIAWARERFKMDYPHYHVGW